MDIDPSAQSESALYNASASSEGMETLHRLSRLSRSSLNLLRQQNIPAVLHVLWEEAQEIAPVTAMCVWQNRSPHTLVDYNWGTPLSEAIITECITTAQPLYLTDNAEAQTTFIMPLTSTAKTVFGVLAFQSETYPRTGLSKAEVRDALSILGEQSALAMETVYKLNRPAFASINTLLQPILDVISDAIFIATPDGNIVTANSACRRLFAFDTLSEMQACTIDVIFTHAGVVDSFTAEPLIAEMSPLHQILTENNPIELTLRLDRFKAGQTAAGTRDVLLKGVPIHRGSTVQYLVFVMRDITRQRQEERLRTYLLRQIEDERSKLDAIVESLSDGLIVTNTTGHIVFYNQQIERMLGTNTETLQGQSWVDTVTQLGDKFVQPEKVIEHVQNSNNLSSPDDVYQYIIHLVDDREIRVTTFPVVANDGRGIGQGSLLHDITSERTADRLKSRFISVASHELRTPLTGIVGFTELLLLREGQVPPGIQHEWLQNINQEALRVSKIVDEMLDLSHIQSGTIMLAHKPVDMIALAHEAIARVRPQGEARVKVINDCHDGVAMAMADTDKALQILINLIDNALKYSLPGNTVTVRTETVVEDSERPMLQVAVEDQGIGIAANEIPKLFTGFYRVRNEQTIGISGTGLGLSIVKNLVELHGGLVRVESRFGVGSTFFFTLPRYYEESVQQTSRVNDTTLYPDDNTW